MPIYMRITKSGLPAITGDATAEGHDGMAFWEERL
jgi:hypothetical protein